MIDMHTKNLEISVKNPCKKIITEIMAGWIRGFSALARDKALDWFYFMAF